MHLVAAGLTFRDAPVDVRERVVIDSDAAHQLLRYLVGHCGLAGAAVLSTCGRTEFYVDAPSAALAAEVVPRLARYLSPTGHETFAASLTAHHRADAVEHLFRVAAGLDSQVVGEPQVLGQFKGAHDVARDAGTLSPPLDFVMRRAIGAGKRVRTETVIGRRALGMGDAAVELARHRRGTLRGRRVLLVGAGEMATVAARRLVAAGASLATLSHGQSAAELARSFHADVIEDITTARTVEIIISSTGSVGTVVTAEAVAELQRRRHHMPLLVLDLAVPRDVESASGSVAGVELLDVDRIAREVGGWHHHLDAALGDAEEIVAAELETSLAVLAERDSVVPTIAAVTREAERIREREVARGLGDAVDPETRRRVDTLTRSLVRKLLHGPVTHLRENADDPAAALKLREIFLIDAARVEASDAEEQAAVS